mgnify:CR=1 FL=1
MGTIGRRLVDFRVLGACPTLTILLRRTVTSDRLLGSFMIDDDCDPVPSGLDRLTRPLQISALRHGLA